MTSLVLILTVIVLVYFSVKQRVYLRSLRIRAADSELPLEPEESPVSRALVELVAVAGGIYLALIMGVNFLKLAMPNMVMISGVAFDPMAAIALAVAICEPYVRRLLQAR